MAAEEKWTRFFQEEYLLFSETILDADRTLFETEQLIKLLQLPPEANILDLGCGQGRISIPLAKRGYRVTGYDGSLALLKEAERRAKAQQADVRFIHGDMRELNLQEQFDCVINLGTAFGYVERESEDAAILRRIYDALKKGGSLVQDLENRERKLKGLMPRTWEDMAGQPVWSRRRFDCSTGRWEEHISWMQGGQLVTRTLDVRLYAATEIIRLTTGAGLSIRGIYGGFDWRPLETDSPRMVVWSVKSD